MILAQGLVDLESGESPPYGPSADHLLPSFPLHKAQELMTRSDFVRQLDRLNLFSITAAAEVRASSVPMHLAFRDICLEPGFREHLAATVKRIADIESLGRTREVVAKDLVQGSRYNISQGEKGVVVKILGGKEKRP